MNQERSYSEDRKDIIYLLGIMSCLSNSQGKQRDVFNCIQKSKLNDYQKTKFSEYYKEILNCYYSLEDNNLIKGLEYYLYTGEEGEILEKSTKDLQDFFRTGDLDRFPFLSNAINHLLDRCNLYKLIDDHSIQRDTSQKVIAIITKKEEEKEYYLVVKENRWDPDNKRSFEGKWGFVKGGVKQGEDEKEAIIREMSEEIKQVLDRSKILPLENKKGYFKVPYEIIDEKSLPKPLKEEEILERDELRRQICRLYYNDETFLSPLYILAVRKLMDLQGEIDHVEWKTREELETLNTNNSINNYFNFRKDRKVFEDRDSFKCRKPYFPRKWLSTM